MKKETYLFEKTHQSSTELPEKVSPKSFPLSFFFEAIGDITNFTFQFFKSLFKPPIEISETLRQSFLIGVQSLSLVGITAFIMGLVLTIQTRPSLALFGAESLLPGMIGVSIVREIGPVITAITTIQHNLKHVTPYRISPEKIAQWSAETAHVLALVEEKIKVVEQVMKWKDIAQEFHDKNCAEDHYGCCGGRSEPNFYECHADCEYRKYYFI